MRSRCWIPVVKAPAWEHADHQNACWCSTSHQKHTTAQRMAWCAPCPCLCADVLGLPANGPLGLQLVYPTVEEVQQSIEGWMGGIGGLPTPACKVDQPSLQQYYHRSVPAQLCMCACPCP